MDNEQLWQSALGELELLLNKASYGTWFKNTFIASFDNDTVTIGTPTTFTHQYLKTKYHEKIVQALKNVTDGKVKNVLYKMDAKPKASSKVAASNSISYQEMPAYQPIATNQFGINSKYVFDTFIVGKNNELAHAAALAVAKNPGFTYNPLFIYGGVGLGKTHLMQAIGNTVISQFPNKKILYTTCEGFTNDYVTSIRSGRIDEFRNKYRKIDILLIDDIQFMAGKEATQEEFFHMFNDFHQTNRQMVLNSDRLPKAIPALEKRLISRFEWGMIADVGMPDFETRLAILNSKCTEKHFTLDPESLQHVATHVQSNIRELEGSLNKVIAHCQLHNVAPTLSITKHVISTMLSTSTKKAVTTKELLKTISEFFDISIQDLTGKSREKKLVVPRQIAMYLLREDLQTSYPTIGQELGGRDHTTAMHAYNKVKGDIENEEKVKQDVEFIRQRLYG